MWLIRSFPSLLSFEWRIAFLFLFEPWLNCSPLWGGGAFFWRYFIFVVMTTWWNGFPWTRSKSLGCSDDPDLVDEVLQGSVLLPDGALGSSLERVELDFAIVALVGTNRYYWQRTRELGEKRWTSLVTYSLFFFLSNATWRVWRKNFQFLTEHECTSRHRGGSWQSSC